MADQAEVEEFSAEAKSAPKRRFDQRDWDYIAQYVIEEWETRKKKRVLREKHWKEIDRQIAMEPDISFKKLPNGKIDARKMWMAEMELPLQAQALEVCTADARRMMFSDTGAWFRANAEMTDEWLNTVELGGEGDVRILGDKAELPSIIDQDNANKLVEGFLLHLFRQNDLFLRMDRINAEALKYGMGVARARMETKNVYIHEARGVRKEKQSIPVLAPCSIKNLYLDEPLPSMHSAQVLGEAHIAEDNIKLANIMKAANSGSNDPEDEDGGWMPDNVKKLEADKDGYVRLLELEGDLIIPRKTVGSIVIPGAIVTVAVGGKEKGGDVTRGVIRFRFRQKPYSSYLLFPYHYEGCNEAYPTSPLEKGRPVQMMCTDALNRLMDSAALKNAPPVGYDRTDMEFAQNGGPVIHPYAQWGTTDPINVYAQIGGDPGALMQVLRLGINFYAELTGVLPARLGAQTVSHTTAFAKDAELTRGAVRTVDYVKTAGQGPLTRWLYMAYDMGRESVDGRVTVFIDAYDSFVELTKDGLPEKASFDWFGSGGPAEEREKIQRKLQSLQLAIQMDQIKTQQGQPPSVDVDAAIKQVLRDGGWTDVDVIVNAQASGAVQNPPPPNPGAQTVALQQLGLAAA